MLCLKELGKDTVLWPGFLVLRVGLVIVSLKGFGLLGAGVQENVLKGMQ